VSRWQTCWSALAFGGCGCSPAAVQLHSDRVRRETKALNRTAPALRPRRSGAVIRAVTVGFEPTEACTSHAFEVREGRSHASHTYAELLRSEILRRELRPATRVLTSECNPECNRGSPRQPRVDTLGGVRRRRRAHESASDSCAVCGRASWHLVLRRSQNIEVRPRPRADLNAGPCLYAPSWSPWQVSGRLQTVLGSYI